VFTLLVGACGHTQPAQVATTPAPSAWVARTNGVPLLAADFDREVLRVLQKGDMDLVDAEELAVRRARMEELLLRQMIDRELFRQAGAKAGITVPDAEVRRQKRSPPT
jgi:hypothetical protein